VVRVERARVPVVRPDAPSRGPESAPVTIQVFSDFECPFCARAAPVLRALEQDLGGVVRVIWRDFPLPGHPHARRAAAAALEVYVERGGAAFWRLHDALFEARATSGLDDAVIDRLASREGVDPRRYAAAVTTGVHDARIDADVEAALAAGVNATPAFFVNDYLTVGALPYGVMRAIVERAHLESGPSAR
jgi:protein-disulfide isomerase